MPEVDGKTVFDEAALLYDKARPSYPEQLVSDVIEYAAIPPDGRILEIGCGPGKATVLFARYGYPILCVEPGPNLVEIAREKTGDYRVEFEVSSFEDWQVEQGAFDLAYLGSSFHWLPEDIALPKLASALKIGGTLALFWNRHPGPQSEALEEIAAAVAKYRPDPGYRIDPSAEFDRSVREQVEKLDASGLFGEVTVKTYPWEQNYSPEEYIELMDTYSGFRVMPPDAKRALFEDATAIIEHHGGNVTRKYVSLLYLMRRK